MAVKRWKVGVVAVAVFLMPSALFASMAALSGMPFAWVLDRLPGTVAATGLIYATVNVLLLLMWWVFKDNGGES